MRIQKSSSRTKHYTNTRLVGSNNGKQENKMLSRHRSTKRDETFAEGIWNRLITIFTQRIRKDTVTIHSKRCNQKGIKGQENSRLCCQLCTKSVALYLLFLKLICYTLFALWETYFQFDIRDTIPSQGVDSLDGRDIGTLISRRKLV